MDNFDTTAERPQMYSPEVIYSEREYATLMQTALTGILEITDDSRLSYNDGRANVVQTQVMDTLAYTAHKQIAFHQRLLESDVNRFDRFLRTEYAEGNEISENRMEQFEQQIERHQVAIAVYEVMKAQAIDLYLNVTGLPEWVPFDQRKKENATPRDRVASAKLQELTRRFGPRPSQDDQKTA